MRLISLFLNVADSLGKTRMKFSSKGGGAGWDLKFSNRIPHFVIPHLKGLIEQRKIGGFKEFIQ